MRKADVTIVGGGPGGFAAALRARKHGFETFLVEKSALGGVCLNEGCIPTKSFIADALRLKKEIPAEEKNLYFPEMIRKKDGLVLRLRRGAAATLKQHGVNVLEAEARVTGPGTVRAGYETIETRFILIATGSRPRPLEQVPFDEEQILSSDGLLGLKEVPGSLLVIGAGPTGCEFASLFHLLGCRVTLVEATPALLPGQDREISEFLKKEMLRQGISVHTGETVREMKRGKDSVEITLHSREVLRADKILVSIGRIPNSHHLGLENLGVLSPKGFVVVDDSMKSAVPSLFAVGDVVGGYPLAHVASHQGRIAVDRMAGIDRKVEREAIPECIFTFPEIGRVGKTEEEERSQQKKIRVGKSFFLASAKAHMLDEKEGFIKLIGEEKTGKLLGAHLIGPHVTELLGELTLALRKGISIPEIADTIHPHPTLSESVEEAARDFAS